MGIFSRVHGRSYHLQLLSLQGKETTIDNEKERTIEKLVSLDNRGESYLHKRVGYNHWVYSMRKKSPTCAIKEESY